MKTIKNTIAVIALSTIFSANVTAQSAKDKPEKILHKITVVKIHASTLQSPQFHFSGPRVDKQPKNREWLEIEAQLKIETKSELDFLPRVDATFHIVTQGMPDFVRIEKTITFQNVNIEDGEAWVSAYVDPDTFRVITMKKRPKVNDITGIAVTVDSANLYKGKDQQYLPYAEKIFDRTIVARRKGAKNVNARWWAVVAIEKDKNGQKILALEETPFYSIFVDRYPLEENKNKSAKN